MGPVEIVRHVTNPGPESRFGLGWDGPSGSALGDRSPRWWGREASGTASV